MRRANKVVNTLWILFLTDLLFLSSSSSPGPVLTPSKGLTHAIGSTHSKGLTHSKMIFSVKDITRWDTRRPMHIEGGSLSKNEKKCFFYYYFRDRDYIDLDLVSKRWISFHLWQKLLKLPEQNGRVHSSHEHLQEAGSKVGQKSLFRISHSLRLFLQSNHGEAEAEKYGWHQELADHHLEEVRLQMSQRKVVAESVPDVSEGFAVRPVRHLDNERTAQPKL